MQFAGILLWQENRDSGILQRIDKHHPEADIIINPEMKAKVIQVERPDTRLIKAITARGV